MNATPERLLTVGELARRLHVGQDKIRELARTGRIPCLQVGKNGLRFSWREVVDALRKTAADRQGAGS